MIEIDGSLKYNQAFTNSMGDILDIFQLKPLENIQSNIKMWMGTVNCLNLEFSGVTVSQDNLTLEFHIHKDNNLLNRYKLVMTFLDKTYYKATSGNLVVDNDTN
jgi:hypothetical protein